MIHYLTVEQVLLLQAVVIQQSGGLPGMRDPDSLDSAVAQPQATFDGIDLYPTLVEKAAALAFSLVKNHAFLDGNKRIGHAAMEAFLIINGFAISAGVDTQEDLFLSLAAGTSTRSDLVDFISKHVVVFRTDQ